MDAQIENILNNYENPSSVEFADIAEAAINGDRKLQNYLKKLWPECSWQTIKERLQIEGSTHRDYGPY